jgi:hypothetical protein
MSHDPAVRTLRLPPANLAGIKIPGIRQPMRNWFRVHQSRHPAAGFSSNTNHRFSHPDCPCSFLYLAADVDTCLFERFGDLAYDRQRTVPQTLWASHSASRVLVPEVRVCDLTNAKTLSALMVDLSALMHIEVAIPQEWGLALQKHPSSFQGIKFKSRFNSRVCLALFQRDGIEGRLEESRLDTLSDHDAAVDWLAKHRVSLY